MRLYAAHNCDDTVRQKSSAGGVFSLLATEVIEKGGVVYGAAFDDNWRVVHRRADNIDDLKCLRRSKYVYSSLGTTISDAINDLSNNRNVLFSGTPCQIAAIHKRVGDNDNLILIEVVCHGAPDAKYWDRYLNEICDKYNHSRNEIESVNFRDKTSGWRDYSFTIKFDDGKIFSQRAADNLYMRAFLSDYTLRQACFKCPFKYPEGSVADITLGDFWGIENVASDLDNNKGTTIVIVRTHKGEQVVSGIKKDGEYELPQVTKYNPAICKASIMPTKYHQFAKEVSSSPILKVFRKYVRRSKCRYIKRLIRRFIITLKK